MNQATQEVYTQTRQLICKLTDAEVQQLGEDISELVLEFTRLELEKKETNKMYNEALKNKMKAIKKNSYLIDAGEEQREINCEVTWNDPVSGKKRITRKDTHEDWIEDMTPDEINLFTQPEINYHDAEDMLPWSYEEE